MPQIAQIFANTSTRNLYHPVFKIEVVDDDTYRGQCYQYREPEVPEVIFGKKIIENAYQNPKRIDGSLKTIVEVVQDKV